MTLLDYVNGIWEPNKMQSPREKLVLFFVSTGCPAGDYTLFDHPDFDYAERCGLLGLTGYVDASGNWQWDGEGNPTDDFGNSFVKLEAYQDCKKWKELENEFN